MRNVDLRRFDIRTDLVKDIISPYKKIKGIKETITKDKDIIISNIKVSDIGEKEINKKKGNYTTIYFSDVTDNTNFNHVKKIFKEELLKIINKFKLKNKDSVLIIGLGNEKSTPDSLGPKTLENVLITKYIYDTIGNLEKGYKITSGITPGVMGTTGIETSDIILAVIKKTKPDLLLVIDSLASDSIERVCKTIQISDTGISPGSGINNKRKEISFNKLGIPVIAIGVPMVVSATTIVNDTIKYLLEHFTKDKKQLDDYTKANLLGLVGLLSDDEKKKLIYEVLNPIGFNLIVTPKEVDFLIDKLSKLLGTGINEALHKI